MGSPSPATVEQIPLFDIPERPELLAMVKAGPAHNGNYTKRDAELVRQAAELFAVGRGCKTVSRKCGIGVHTARALRNWLTESGQLAPHKARVSGKLGEVIEDGWDIYHDAMLSGEVHPSQLPVALGIATDKKGQIDAGIVPGTSRAESELAIDRVRAAFEALRRANSISIDSVSIGQPCNGLPVSTSRDGAAGAVATSPPPSADTAAGSDGPGPGDDGARPADQSRSEWEGGGSASARRVQCDDETSSKLSGPKEYSHS